jgi:phosphoglycolate phosphatase
VPTDKFQRPIAMSPVEVYCGGMSMRNILFDLDGTLTDPAEGIIKCYQYSLGRLNVRCPPPEELAAFIGPPIRATFAEALNACDESLIEQAVTIYRERFSTVGLFENSIYEGVPEMLSALQSTGFKLFVATSKPKIYAERILIHFSLDGYFIKVHGNELNGRLDDKADLVSELISEHGLRPDETLMIGDRRHDVAAAKRNNISSLGVTYGYGSEDELMKAGVDHICHSPAEIVRLIKRRA